MIQKTAMHTPKTVKRVNPNRNHNGAERRQSGLYKFGQEGFTVTSNTLHQLIADKTLHGDTLRVLAFMQLNAARNNRFEGTHQWIAESLDMQRPNVSREISKLKELQLIIKVTEPNGHKYWYIDARRSFRGSAERHGRELERQAKQRNKDRRSNVVALNA